MSYQTARKLQHPASPAGQLRLNMPRNNGARKIARATHDASSFTTRKPLVPPTFLAEKLD